MLAAAAKRMKGTPEIHIAEVIDIKEALSWVKRTEDDRRARGVIQQVSYLVESDCLLAVKAVLSDIEIYSSFGGVVSDCRRILRCLNNVSIVSVKRSGPLLQFESRWYNQRGSCPY